MRFTILHERLVSLEPQVFLILKLLLLSPERKARYEDALRIPVQRDELLLHLPIFIRVPHVPLQL